MAKLNDLADLNDTNEDPGAHPGIGETERDVIALGIAAAGIIMFVGTGGTVLPQVLRSLAGHGVGPDNVLVNALLLNIALIIFGWRRCRQLGAEVRERRLAEEKARLLAETDPLTGLLNRRSLGNAIDAMIARTRDSAPSLAVMMIDLDNFKRINDSNGHGVGDMILLECARRIGKALPSGSLLGRIGGDEFACALKFDARRPAPVDQVATAILEALCQPIRTGEVELEVTGSIGIARAEMLPQGEEPCDGATRLLDMADIAMYHAKRQGRNCSFWFELRMAEEMRFRSELEAGIRKGVPAGEFVPYYEKQIDLQTGEVTGFEMLARWQSPRFGLVGPDIFIPVAEEIGMIAALSESVIAQALEDAKDWDPGLTLAVNISPYQMRDPWFSQKLLKLLISANFPPSRLEIEITESCLHENIGAVRTMIASLKNQGIRVSIDDFGTGYSSLAQLRSLPFDRIKIDRSFVMNLVENEDSEAIVHAIAMLGKGLRMPITVEGIESQEVLDRLMQYGEIKGQGYLYGRPEPASKTREWLAGRACATTAAGIGDAQADHDPLRERLAGNG